MLQRQEKPKLYRGVQSSLPAVETDLAPRELPAHSLGRSPGQSVPVLHAGNGGRS